MLLGRWRGAQQSMTWLLASPPWYLFISDAVLLCGSSHLIRNRTFADKDGAGWMCPLS